MTPERWKKLDALFHEALGLQGEARAVHLAKACGSDEQLRVEAERLIAAHEREGSFIDSPVLAEAAKLADDDHNEFWVGRSLGPYKVVSLLGRGGMGEVYSARDTKLDRMVALKILPEKMSADGERMRRFSREAKAASALNHPNVAHIYEIGEAEGVNFIAMEYVEGQTLAAKINGHPLEVSEIVEIGSQIADVLDEAHGKGVTHRDIKPANVMLTPRGQVKVLDFGLAKMARPSAQPMTSDISTLAKTAPGVVMGTVPYMSPEQALGRDVDHRSDLFSLGVVLYEMATGRLPFAGANASETLDRILHSQPEAMARFNYDIPVELERIVRKCLEKERERRCQSARELLVDLKNLKRDSQSGAVTATQVALPSRFRRRLLIAFAVALLALGGLALYLLLTRAQPGGQAINSIAVLPFKPVGVESRDEALEMGAASILITRLGSLRQLIVRPESAVERYARPDQDPLAAGREQKVDAVLDSHYQRYGDKLRFRLRLLRVADGATMWADTLDQQAADPFAIEDALSAKVTGALRLTLSSTEKELLAKRYTKDAEAYDLYLKGLQRRYQSTPQDMKRSIEYFEQAIAKDPNYALAYAGLSNAYNQLPQPTSGGLLSPREAAPKAKWAAEKAIELDDTLAEAHRALADVKVSEWDWEAAERECKRALELNPNYALAHILYGAYLSFRGRHDEAIAEVKRAVELDPLDRSSNIDLGFRYYIARRYDEAIGQARKTVELDPNWWMGHNVLAWAYERKGLYQEALAEFLKAKSLSGDNKIYSAQIGRIYAVLGKQNEAQKAIDELESWSRQSYVSGYQMALIYAGMGNKDQALAQLERAYQDHDISICWVKVDPRFDPIRTEPKFADLVRRMGL